MAGGDYIEETAEGKISAYEFKFNPKKANQAKCPEKFRKAYPQATFTAISKDNFAAFVSATV